MLFNKLDDMFGPFKFPSMHFPKMVFPQMDMSRAGAQESMSATTTHCVNGTCDSKVQGPSTEAFSSHFGALRFVAQDTYKIACAFSLCTVF